MARSAYAPPLGTNATSTRLRECLSLLAAESRLFRARRRENLSPDKDLVARIALEVDETVLPRGYALVSRGRVVASLTVSNRRLTDMRIAGTSVLPDTEGDMQVETAARSYVGALKRLQAAHPELALLPTGRGETGTKGCAACSAVHLLQFGTGPDRDIRLRGFLDRLAPEATGWIARFGGQDLAAAGLSADFNEKLRRIAEVIDAVPERQAALRRLDRDVPTCAAMPFSDAFKILCARDGDDHVLAILPHSLISGVIADWRARYRPDLTV